MRTEIWRTAIVNGETWENYQVSNLGRVINLNYRGTGKAKLAELTKRKDGYFQVGLSKNEKTKYCLVHRLVAEVFLPNPENKPEVNHKIEDDEGKTINIVIFNEDGTINKEKTTIEWCTHEYNINYGTRNEKVAKAKINGKTSKTVLQFTLDGELIREWPSTKECGRNGFNQGSIVECCNGKRKSAYGFIWRYK